MLLLLSTTIRILIESVTVPRRSQMSNLHSRSLHAWLTINLQIAVELSGDAAEFAEYESNTAKEASYPADITYSSVGSDSKEASLNRSKAHRFKP